jgi:hypothetical protein
MKSMLLSSWRSSLCALFLSSLPGALAGCGGDSPSLTVTPPTAGVPPRGSRDFTASGGTGGYSWSLLTNASGGSISSAGHYVAGSMPSVTDLARVTDSAGLAATVMINVGPGIHIAPPGTVWPFSKHLLAASGGSGDGYVWSIATNGFGATLDAAGSYTAGSTAAVTDALLVTDSLGNTATLSVRVSGVLSVTPQFTVLGNGDSVQLQVAGGTGSATWAVSINPSGGRVDSAGLYSAGRGGGTDVVKVTDANGDVGFASVRVAPPLGGFQSASHQEEQITSQGGAVLKSPTLVTLAYASDPNRQSLEQFADYLVHSSWLTQVGAEYGVVQGNHASVVLQGSPPPTITDSQIQHNIAQWVADGTAPSGDQYIYMFLAPPMTTVLSGGADLCAISGGGYHAELARSGGSNVTYAVAAGCPNNARVPVLADLQTTMSHELIEAITDPFPFTAPGYGLPFGWSDVWAQYGGEIADLCSFAPGYLADGYALTQVWSNASSLAGAAPCVPAADAYYNVSVSPTGMQPVQPGQTISFTLTGWSSGPVGTWNIYADAYAAPCCASFTPHIALEQTTMMNGGTVMLTVTIPPDAPSQSASLIAIGSYKTRSTIYAALTGMYVQ